MKELVRSNDPVLFDWLQVLLRDIGIETVIFDSHMSILEGSAGAIQRRLMVMDDDYQRARARVVDVGEGNQLV